MKTLTEIEINEVKHFLRKQAEELGYDDFMREYYYATNPHNRGALINNGYSSSDMLIDFVLEYDESLLPQSLRGLDLLNIQRSIFETDFMEELNNIIKDNFFDQARKEYSANFKLYDPDFAKEMFQWILDKRTEELNNRYFNK